MPRPTKEVDTSTFSGQVAGEIRRRRLKKFPRAEDAAAAAGVPMQTWYGWEKGKIHLDAMPTVAAALGCKPRALLPS
jgi:hypothetical protein